MALAVSANAEARADVDALPQQVVVEHPQEAVPSAGGKPRRVTLSRQMVLFCVERRRAWRMLQSRAGIENPDYLAQREALEARG